MVDEENQPPADLTAVGRQSSYAETLVERFRTLPSMDPAGFRADIDATVDPHL